MRERNPKATYALLGGCFLIGAVIAVIMVLSGSGSSSATKTVQAGKPQIVSAPELRSFAASLGRPVFWAGTRPGTRLELTQLANNNIYVRYLTPGAANGSKSTQFVTVGTYPKTGAYAAVQAQKNSKRATVIRVPDGIALYRNDSKSVYAAYPGTDELIEVYAPVTGQALQLLRSGAVGPVR